MKTAIIQCQWMRQFQFKETIQQLNKQTDKNFDLFVWNNNYDLNANTFIDTYAENAEGYRVFIVNNKVNLRGFARMISANMLLNDKYPVKGSDYDKIITIDDDAKLAPNFVEYMHSKYEPKSYKGRHAFKILNNNYWNRLPLKDNENADYVGTNGSIIDASIFQTDDFQKTYNYDASVYWMEDVALTLYCKKIGWNTKAILDNGTYIPNKADRFEQSIIHHPDEKVNGYLKLKQHYGI